MLHNEIVAHGRPFHGAHALIYRLILGSLPRTVPAEDLGQGRGCMLRPAPQAR